MGILEEVNASYEKLSPVQKRIMILSSNIRIRSAFTP